MSEWRGTVCVPIEFGEPADAASNDANELGEFGGEVFSDEFGLRRFFDSMEAIAIAEFDPATDGAAAAIPRSQVPPRDSDSKILPAR